MKRCIALTLAVTVLAGVSKGSTLTEAWWNCGQYTNVEPIDGGTVLVDDYDSEGPWLDSSTNRQTIYNDSIVFSEGSVVQPSASVALSDAITGPAQSVSSSFETSAAVFYYGMVVAGPGAPAGALVPLILHVRGFAQCDPVTANASADVGAYSELRIESSTLYIPGNDCGIGVSVDGIQTYADYDVSYPVSLPAGVPFEGYVDASALITLDWTLGTTSWSGEAFADPSIQIDPSYAYKDFFSLEYSDNLPVPEPSTLSLLAGALLLLARRSPRSRRGVEEGTFRLSRFR